MKVNYSKNFYASLEIKSTATEKEIKVAYRILVKKYHPDINPNNKVAEEKFKEVAEAYEILSNLEKKADYDRYSYHSGNSSTDQSNNPFDERRSKPKPDASSSSNYWSDGDRMSDFFKQFAGNRGRNSRFNDGYFDEDFRTYESSPKYNPSLDITHTDRVEFFKLYDPNFKIITTYQRNFTKDGKREVRSEFLPIKINPEKELIDIRYDSLRGEYYIVKTVEKMGNEATGMPTRSILDGSLDYGKQYGHLQIHLYLDIPAGIKFDGTNIHQIVNVNLYDILFEDDIILEMATGKTGKVKLKSYSSLNNINVSVANMGLINSYGKKGNYIFEFRTPALKMENLSESEREKFRKLLAKLV